jgi:hypothetical protein
VLSLVRLDVSEPSSDSGVLEVGVGLLDRLVDGDVGLSGLEAIDMTTLSVLDCTNLLSTNADAQQTCSSQTQIVWKNPYRQLPSLYIRPLSFPPKTKHHSPVVKTSRQITSETSLTGSYSVKALPTWPKPSGKPTNIASVSRGQTF